ncbi:hypothetical protein [Syntrophorhabdus aromaticivorans]|uniref:hypothetical protein n=1 Tax=Syntrophorhabdus aromaticivorans TaxID=328301 RepID=UPI00048E1FE0|nr:hypothetical protein [Syntrophorhabdus aromaticivorans]
MESNGTPRVIGELVTDCARKLENKRFLRFWGQPTGRQPSQRRFWLLCCTGPWYCGWFLDRFRKGIGTPALDTLIFESSEAKYRGSAFGSIVLSIRWVPW